MFIICFGARKSGSTLSFQLVSGLLESCGHRQDDLPDGAVEKGRVQHFAPGSSSSSDEWLNVLERHAGDPRLYAVKFHGSCTPRLAQLIADGKVLAVVNTRDPRDMVLALLDAGQRNTKGPFSKICSTDDALTSVKASLDTTSAWLSTNAFAADYSETAFETHGFLTRLAGYLGIDAPDAETARRIRAQADARSATKNVMRPTRFADTWTLRQTAWFTQHLEPGLERLSAHYANDRWGGQATYPWRHLVAREERLRNVTEKTFVVLGAPRGGTSLLAGSLHSAGVFMGPVHRLGGQYEDPDFKIPIRVAKRGNEAERLLLPRIVERNAQHPSWGWKVPNSIYYIRQVQHLLINPTYLFIYRDPVAIARSSARHDRRNWLLHRRRLLRVARGHTKLVREFERSLPRRTRKVSLQLEEVMTDIPGFVDLLREEVASATFDGDAVKRFIRPSGGYVAPSATL